MEATGPLPLHCIDPTNQPPTLGVACEGCPLNPANCLPLSAGRIITAQTTEIGQLTERVATLEDSIGELSLDALLGNYFTPEGLKYLIGKDANLAAELLESEWGILRIDTRFLSIINELGKAQGDNLLVLGANQTLRLLNESVRRQPDRRRAPLPVTEDQRQHSDRRKGYTDQRDLICREGGDELMAIVRNVRNPHELAEVAGRLQLRFSVREGIDQMRTRRLPLIASVGYHHVQNFQPDVLESFRSSQDAWGLVNFVNESADQSHRDIKYGQYQAMWREVTFANPTLRGLYPAQPDDRIVARLFMHEFWPTYQSDVFRSQA